MTPQRVITFGAHICAKPYERFVPLQTSRARFRKLLDTRECVFFLPVDNRIFHTTLVTPFKDHQVLLVGETRVAFVVVHTPFAIANEVGEV